MVFTPSLQDVITKSKHKADNTGIHGHFGILKLPFRKMRKVGYRQYYDNNAVNQRVTALQ